jgi:two-component system, sensor histidine kinase and response regulator
MNELRQRRSIFFALRGVLGFVIVALLFFHHAEVSARFWILGIAFLISDLLILFLPLSWFRNAGLSYVTFLLDIAAVSVFLYLVPKIDSEALLLYYLAVFMGALGEDLRKSVGVAAVLAVLYAGLHLNKQETFVTNPELLLKIPLFFVTSISTGYLVQEIRVNSRQRAELREMQKAKELAEAAARVKSEFLAHMSHEIRTPMNAIIGMTDLTLDTDLSSEQREYLGMIKASGDSLLTVINDILDFSKIEAGKLNLDAIEFDLRDSLEETIRMFALRAQQKGLELVCDVRPDVPQVVRGDPTRLRQIVVNLVGNAIKFTERGEVVLRVELNALNQGDNELHFSIQDTGIGISPEKQKLIFEAFAQGDNSSARKYGGTGLGLTISSRLVEMMRGRIWVESKLGHGSTFHFTTCLGVVNRVTTLSLAEPVRLADLPVLVVDDNASNRRFLEEVLTRWGMRPTSVDSGKGALESLRRAGDSGQPFPLVLTDAQMPGMDGFKLADLIRQNSQTSGTPIVMLASGGQPGDAARCRESGIAAYLAKPVRQAELREAISQVLSPESRQNKTTLVTRHSLREGKAAALRILLAEDNIVNQTLAKRLLEKYGHTVVVTGSGREALAAVEQQSFDLVLMDVHMPDMDGLEATSAIREKERVTRTHLPIIAMTACAMKGDRDRCLQAGMDGYVSKPIHAQELLEAIEASQGSPPLAVVT